MADLIDLDALLNNLKESVKAAREWREETQDEEIKIRAEQAHGTFIECALRVKNAPVVNRWISVEDALPEIKKFHISDTVLCYCDSGTLAIARLEENGFGQVGFNCEKDDEYHHSAGKVLYWMPIPEIPEPPMETENENR